MNDKELRRGEVLGRVKRGELKLSEAAQLLEISCRHTKRIWRRYAAGGTQALRHGNVGRVSNRAKPAEVRKRVLQLVRENYSGEPEYAALWADAGGGVSASSDHDQQSIGRETLAGLCMSAAGLWKPHRRKARRPHRSWRERKAQPSRRTAAMVDTSAARLAGGTRQSRSCT